RQRGSATLQLYIAGVVVGMALPLAVNEDIEVGEGPPLRHRAITIFQINEIALSIRGAIEVRIGGRNGLRNFGAGQQMSSLGTDVVHLKRGVLRELALEGERPLLNIGVARVLRY